MSLPIIHSRHFWITWLKVRDHQIVLALPTRRCVKKFKKMALHKAIKRKRERENKSFKPHTAEQNAHGTSLPALPLLRPLLLLPSPPNLVKFN
uniref:Uncharacterized protein n=1 Tax=Zea mays TaxID=4577 RepID=C0PPC5_MAIZE|nr:unknown [Zea mays]